MQHQSNRLVTPTSRTPKRSAGATSQAASSLRPGREPWPRPLGTATVSESTRGGCMAIDDQAPAIGASSPTDDRTFDENEPPVGDGPFRAVDHGPGVVRPGDNAR